jgi:plastocyanin/rubrerythrin
METIEGERGRIRSRRALLATGAKVAAGGALGLAFAGPAIVAPSQAALATALAQDFEDDVDILNYALTLEHLEHVFYREGLDTLGEADIADATDDEAFGLLTEIRDHEAAHVEALTQVITDLGGEPVAEATYDFGYDDVAGFLEVAMALENTGVAAYAGAAPSISDEAILTAALGIHSVEARHASFLNRLNGMSPFPDDIDQPLTREEVLAVAGGFITGESSESTPEEGAASEGGEEAVTIDMFKFMPAMIEVPVGTIVTWTNQELNPHSVIADEGAFESETLGDGESFTFTFEEAGSFTYYCGFHTMMKGEVVVS